MVLCVFYIRGSRNFRQGGREVRGSRQKKLHCLEKNSGKLFFVFSPNLQLLNSFAEGGRSDFFWFDLILFVPSTIFQLYRGRPICLESSTLPLSHCAPRGGPMFFLGKLYNFPWFQRGFNILQGGGGVSN